MYPRVKVSGLLPTPIAITIGGLNFLLWVALAGGAFYGVWWAFSPADFWQRFGIVVFEAVVVFPFVLSVAIYGGMLTFFLFCAGAALVGSCCSNCITACRKRFSKEEEEEESA